VSTVRSLTCWLMLAVFPASLLAQSPSAIVHTQGGVWVNGSEARDASAIFSGDLLETKPGYSATLNLDGSSVLIQPESVAKFDGDAVELDHGSVSVETSRSFRVLVHCITAIPVENAWTQYDVTDLNGSVEVSARTKDVNVKWERGKGKASPDDAPAQAGSAQPGSSPQGPGQQASVHQGEQRKFDESEVCGLAAKPSGMTLPNPKWIAAGAAGAGILIWIIVQGGGSKTPISNSQP